MKLFSGAVAGEVSVEGIYLDLAIESFSFLFFTSLVYKRKLQKNGTEVASSSLSLGCVS